MQFYVLIASLFFLVAASQSVDITGQVEVLSLDTPGQDAFHVYHIYANDHQDTLIFDDASKAPARGGPYRVTGERTSNSTIRVSSCVSTASLRSQEKRFRTTEVRTLVAVRVTFTGQSYGPAPDEGAIRDMIWDGATSVNGFYAWATQGAITFKRDRNNDGNADVYSVSIAQPVICFDIPRMARDAILNAMGVDIFEWQHHIMIFSSDYTGCGIGVGNIGCNQNACNVYASMMRGDIFTHELGHNLGLDHANSMNLFGIGTTPRWSEYTDYSSAMSLSLNLPRRGFNPIDLDNLDLLPATSIKVVSLPNTQLQHVLADLYASSGTRVIRLTTGGITYHISYRQGAAGTYDSDMGMDFYHPLYPGRWNGRVFIHRLDSTGSKMSFLEAQVVVGDMAGWTSPDGQWMIRFASSAGFQANVLIGTPAQVMSGTLGGSGNPTTASVAPTTTTTKTTTTTPTTTTTTKPTTTTTKTTTTTPTTTTTTKPTTTTTKTTTTKTTTTTPTTTTTTKPTTTTRTTTTTKPTAGGTIPPYGTLPEAPNGALFAPARIQAEYFDVNGYYDTTSRNLGGAFRTSEAVDIETCNEGGYNVGWMVEGEWMDYTVNVLNSGWYQTTFRTASRDGGGLLYLMMDGYGLAGPVNVMPTNNWQMYKTLMLVERFYIPAGIHKFRIYVHQGGCNMNWWELVQVDPNSPPLTLNNGQVPTVTDPKVTYAVCGNGRCEAGENCFSCKSDCNGYMGSRVQDRFCCSGDRTSGYLESTGWNDLVSATSLCVPPPPGVLPAL